MTCEICEKEINGSGTTCCVDDARERCSCVCHSCRADAKLGRAVRGMKDGCALFRHGPNEWGVDNCEWNSICTDESTPEAALIAAGLMEEK